jgi:hypothetical protein
MRPHPWTPKPISTIWLDYVTGEGVNDAGARVKATPGDRRQKPNLTDKLNLAGQLGVERIMFTGEIPKHDPEHGNFRVHWLTVRTPDWTAGQHWISSSWRSVTGRFTHAVTQQKVTLKVAAEWFGDVPLTPAEARQAWQLTEVAIKRADEKATLFLSPTATGTNLWALSLPKNIDPVLVSDDIADELRNTSGQHHVEHLVAGPSFIDHPDVVPLVTPAKTLDTFAYVDGRFMYSAVCRELGIGPAIRLNRAAAYELLETQPYARARYYVRFQVPEAWDHIGLLPMKDPERIDRWIYPNRPGAIGETWADSSEIHVAKNAGWMIDPLEAIQFTTETLGRKASGNPGVVKARPLDTFADRMVRVREAVTQNPGIPPTIRQAVTAALRAILLYTIGGFHSVTRETTHVVESALDIPPGTKWEQVGDVFVYRVPAPKLDERNRQFWHPEFSVQVWGRARARLLSGPAANGMKSGALTLDPRTLLGVYGDALYTSVVPDWSLPTEYGGGDDGKVGRLRLQGVVKGRLTFPDTIERRDRLRVKASKNGIQAALDELVAS